VSCLLLIIGVFLFHSNVQLYDTRCATGSININIATIIFVMLVSVFNTMLKLTVICLLVRFSLKPTILDGDNKGD